MASELEQLYQDVLLDHFKKPRCFGELVEADASMCLMNPLCGDQIEISVIEGDEGNSLKTIRFNGKGCSISQASASMLSEYCEGKSIDEIRTVLEDFRAVMRGEKSPEDFSKNFGDLPALLGVRRFSARIKCALLAGEALDKCISQLDKKHAKTT